MNYSIPGKSKRSFNRKMWVYATMILKGANSGFQYGGEAFRLFFLAKDFDIAGNGKIFKDEFIDDYLVGTLQLKKYNILRWLNSYYGKALLPDLLTYEGEQIKITSYLDACKLLKIPRIIQKTEITVGKLISRNWKANLFKGFSKNIEGSPMSRATKEKLTGVKAKTQRSYEKKSKVKVRRNYAISDYDKDLLSGFQENVKPNAFINRGVICWGLPNTVKVSGVKKYKGTRSRNKINKQLKEQSESVVGLNCKRIYLMDKEQVEKAKRKADFYNVSIQYLKTKVRYDTGFYHAVIL